MHKLWDRVNKTDTCWLWMGGKDACGYGVLNYDGKTRSAHKLAYELTKGPVQKGLVLMHSCDTPSCINPDHLTPGTYSENSRDMVSKKRNRPRGLLPKALR